MNQLHRQTVTPSVDRRTLLIGSKQSHACWIVAYPVYDPPEFLDEEGHRGALNLNDKYTTAHWHAKAGVETGPATAHLVRLLDGQLQQVARAAH